MRCFALNPLAFVLFLFVFAFPGWSGRLFAQDVVVTDYCFDGKKDQHAYYCKCASKQWVVNEEYSSSLVTGDGKIVASGWGGITGEFKHARNMIAWSRGPAWYAVPINEEYRCIKKGAKDPAPGKAKFMFDTATNESGQSTRIEWIAVGRFRAVDWGGLEGTFTSGDEIRWENEDRWQSLVPRKPQATLSIPFKKIAPYLPPASERYRFGDLELAVIGYKGATETRIQLVPGGVVLSGQWDLLGADTKGPFKILLLCSLEKGKVDIKSVSVCLLDSNQWLAQAGLDLFKRAEIEDELAKKGPAILAGVNKALNAALKDNLKDALKELKGPDKIVGLLLEKQINSISVYCCHNRLEITQAAVSK